MNGIDMDLGSRTESMNGFDLKKKNYFWNAKFLLGTVLGQGCLKVRDRGSEGSELRLGFLAQRGVSQGQDSRIKFCKQDLSDPKISSRLENQTAQHNLFENRENQFVLWVMITVFLFFISINDCCVC